jgi:PPIC-type PPIASE domain/SurA-like N-terminal domain
MTVIAILSIPFCIYFVKTDISGIRSDRFARIYDHTVTIVEAQRIARLFRLVQAIGLVDLQQSLAAGAKDDNEAVTAFILNLLIVRHEADRLGIRPTQSEIVDAIHNLQPFRSDAGFDLKKYDDFVQNLLSPNGLDEGEMEELVRDDLALKKIKQVINTGVSISPEVSKANFDEAYGKVYTTVLRLPSADVAKDIKISDEDIKKYFDGRKAEFKTEEKRKVDFIELALSDEQKKLKGKDRIDALQKLADRANDVSQALLEKDADFSKVAAQFKLAPHTTGEFTAAAPDPQFKDAGQQLDSAAFKLTKQEPVSDPIQVGDGFYILHLANVADARPLTLEEAKPKVVDLIKKQRTQEQLAAKGGEMAKKLREAIKSGKTIEAAAQEAGMKAEKIPPFTMVDEPKGKPDEKQPSESPEMMQIKNAVYRLQPGDLSDFVSLENGGFIAALEKREPPDPAKYPERKATFDDRYLNGKQQVVFNEWLRERQRDAGVLQSAPQS